LITGGSGLIGTALTGLLSLKGYKIIILSRSARPSKGNVSYSLWDINRSLIDPRVIREADHIIHLSGAGVADKRWTAKRKNEILKSRVDGSKLLVKALGETENKVKTVVSASGIGWYGMDKAGSPRPFIEADPPDSGFLGETCRLWEESIHPVTNLGKRLVICRTGIVLSNNGGAFPEFVKPLKAGVAGILGSGRQMVSWIHIDDICRLYLSAVENQYMNGVYNATAPEVVSNKELILKIAKARKRPYIPIHVPEFALKLLLGEMSIEVLKSTSVDDSRVRNAGFNFLFPGIDAAINELIRVK
jgi:uncharacterized protein (TIGR01777 family)